MVTVLITATCVTALTIRAGEPSGQCSMHQLSWVQVSGQSWRWSLSPEASTHRKVVWLSRLLRNHPENMLKCHSCCLASGLGGGWRGWLEGMFDLGTWVLKCCPPRWRAPNRAQPLISLLGKLSLREGKDLLQLLHILAKLQGESKNIHSLPLWTSTASLWAPGVVG